MRKITGEEIERAAEVAAKIVVDGNRELSEEAREEFKKEQTKIVHQMP